MEINHQYRNENWIAKKNEECCSEAFYSVSCRFPEDENQYEMEVVTAGMGK